jgi:hypothetical protein
MKSLVAALGAASLLAFAAVPASAPPITFCNPLGRSRGVGAGIGRL